MLDLCLFDLFWLFTYDDDVEKARSRCAPLTSKHIVIGEGISGVCSSLTMIRDPMIGCLLFCLTDPFLWNGCMLNPPSTLFILFVFWISLLFCTILDFALLQFALLWSVCTSYVFF